MGGSDPYGPETRARMDSPMRLSAELRELGASAWVQNSPKLTHGAVDLAPLFRSPLGFRNFVEAISKQTDHGRELRRGACRRLRFGLPGKNGRRTEPAQAHVEGHERIADAFFSCYFNIFDQPMVSEWWIITSIHISGKKNLVVLGPSRSHPKSKE